MPGFDLTEEEVRQLRELTRQRHPEPQAEPQAEVRSASPVVGRQRETGQRLGEGTASIESREFRTEAGASLAVEIPRKGEGPFGVRFGLGVLTDAIGSPFTRTALKGARELAKQGSTRFLPGLGLFPPELLRMGLDEAIDFSQDVEDLVNEGGVDSVSGFLGEMLAAGGPLVGRRWACR